jgi:hypothetical protein
LFPFAAVEEWFGAEFEPRLAHQVGRLAPDQVAEFANFIRSSANRPDALPQRSASPGELRPNVATMRTLDPFWGPSNLMDRLCTVLLYSHAATAFDPLSFTVEEWARSDGPKKDDLGNLQRALSQAFGLLAVLQPLATSGALDLLPPALTRDFAPNLAALEVVPSLMDVYDESGLKERIGDFNTQLGGSHLSARFQGYVHLWEILQDLMLVESYPGILQPLFVAGFDAELADLLVPPRAPAGGHMESLAAFRFPSHALSPAKVSELRDVDGFHRWRDAVQSALAGIDLKSQDKGEAQDYVHLTLRPAAEEVMRTFESRVWREIVQTGVKRMVIGASSAGASIAAGGSALVSIASHLGAAAADTALNAVRARGRKTALDVPFLSLTPDDDPQGPVAIPKLGPLF